MSMVCSGVNIGWSSSMKFFHAMKISGWMPWRMTFHVSNFCSGVPWPSACSTTASSGRETSMVSRSRSICSWNWCSISTFCGRLFSAVRSAR